jgi:hypothetical protein
VAELFEGVIALEGSISGEHGIGFAKKPYIGLELSDDVLALMQRVKGRVRPSRHSESGKNLSVRRGWGLSPLYSRRMSPHQRLMDRGGVAVRLSAVSLRFSRDWRFSLLDNCDEHCNQQRRS